MNISRTEPLREGFDTRCLGPLTQSLLQRGRCVVPVSPFLLFYVVTKGPYISCEVFARGSIKNTLLQCFLWLMLPFKLCVSVWLRVHECVPLHRCAEVREHLVGVSLAFYLVGPRE